MAHNGAMASSFGPPRRPAAPELASSTADALTVRLRKPPSLGTAVSKLQLANKPMQPGERAEIGLKEEWEVVDVPLELFDRIGRSSQRIGDEGQAAVLQQSPDARENGVDARGRHERPSRSLACRVLALALRAARRDGVISVIIR